MKAAAASTGDMAPPEVSTLQFLERFCGSVAEPIDLPVAIICAHPDDETIGAGTRLSRLSALSIVHATDGAPRSMSDALNHGFESCASYAAARREELEDALNIGKARRPHLYELGFADQATTEHLLEVSQAVYDLLSRISPEVVITHPYEGGHPDHDATAFAVHLACTLIERKTGSSPSLLEMTSYHNRCGAFAAGDFLPGNSELPAATAWLNDRERAVKKRMFECFRTQASVLAPFPVDAERFRPAPRYDFSKPPHPGTLFYELHPWGMTGTRFRSQAVTTLQAFQLPEHLLL